MPLPSSDVIYVNAGATRPSDFWLDALKDGGRLILPLTASFTTRAGHSMTQGAVFLIKRKGEEYEAMWKSETAIYPCAGMREETSEKALAQALQKGGWEKVTRLYRTGELEQDRCWLQGPDWSLAY